MAKLEIVSPVTGSPRDVWAALRCAAEDAARDEPQLASQLNSVILSHDDLSGALSFQIARKLGDSELGAMTVREVALAAMQADPSIVRSAEADLLAVEERDPAIRSMLQPFLYFKGYQALQSWRVAHWLWEQGRDTLAFHFQSRISELFQVDIRLWGLCGPRHRHCDRRDRCGRRRGFHAPCRHTGRHGCRAR